MNKLKAMKAVCLSAVLSVALSGCSAMQGIGTAAGLIGGDTPSVDATAQVGKENRQEGDAVVDNRRVEDRQVEGGVEDSDVEVSEVSGVSNVTSQNLSDQSQEQQTAESGVSSRDWYADTVNQVTNLDQIPTPFLILLVLGWLLPGPVEILKGLGAILKFLRDLVLGR